LLDFFGRARLVRVEDDVTAAETLFNLDQAQLEPWAELVKSDGDLGVLFLILIVLWQGNFTAR